MEIRTLLNTIDQNTIMVNKIIIHDVPVIILTGNIGDNFLDVYNSSKDSKSFDDLYFSNSFNKLKMKSHKDIKNLSTKPTQVISTIFIDGIFSTSESDIIHLTNVLRSCKGYLVGFDNSTPKQGYWYNLLYSTFPEIWV